MFSNEEEDLLIKLSELVDPWSPANLYIHAILNSKSIETLTDAYLSGFLKKSILSNLSKRLGERVPNDEYFEYLISCYISGDYLKRTRSRKLILAMEKHLNYEQLLTCFYAFLNSPYRYDYETALAFAPKIWGKEIEERLDSLYNQTVDYRILKVFLEVQQYDYLQTKIKSIWEANCPPHVKKIFFRNFDKFDFKELIFLKELDPFNYLKAAYIKGIKLSEDEIKNVYESLPIDAPKEYIVGLIAKMGHIEIVISHIKLYAQSLD